jgi:hypothetical protein
VYSDFYEIPLPALRFEKVEENSPKVNDTKENDAFKIRPRQRNKTNVKKDDIRRSSTLKKHRFTRKATTHKGDKTHTEKERQ